MLSIFHSKLTKKLVNLGTSVSEQSFIYFKMSVVRWTSSQKDVRLPLSAGGGGDATPPSPVWIWGGENLLYLSPPVKGTVQ